MGTVQVIATTELGKNVGRMQSDADATEIQTRVRTLLRGPLGVEDAVQIALLNNRGLQVSFAELAVADAERVQASLPPSPTISLSRLAATGYLEIERQVIVNVLQLATLPRRAEIAEVRFAQARLRSGQAVLRLAAETRRSYYRAVAAGRLVGFLEESKTAAEAASELSRKLGETGAVNKLHQAREHAFYAELGTQLATARLRRETEREQLTRLMGLWGSDVQYRLPAALPELPARPKTLRQIEADAIEQRIDLCVARMELDALAKSFGLTTATRFVTDLEVAGISKFERDGADRTKSKGAEVEFQIPIFDFGEARERQAEALYMQTIHRLADLAINIRSEARTAYQTYRAAYDISMQYQKEVLPLRKIISDETLLQYNAMIADPSELLVDARNRISSNVAAIEAKRDFWLATINLRAAVVGGGAGSGGETEVATRAAPQAEAGGHD